VYSLHGKDNVEAKLKVEVVLDILHVNKGGTTIRSFQTIV